MTWLCWFTVPIKRPPVPNTHALGPSPKATTEPPSGPKDAAVTGCGWCSVATGAPPAVQTFALPPSTVKTSDPSELNDADVGARPKEADRSPVASEIVAGPARTVVRMCAPSGLKEAFVRGPSARNPESRV